MNNLKTLEITWKYRLLKIDFEYLKTFFCYKGKSSKVSENSGYFQLFAGFQHKHFLHTKWSFLAENGPQIVKYAYFVRKFSRKADTSLKVKISIKVIWKDKKY